MEEQHNYKQALAMRIKKMRMRKFGSKHGAMATCARAAGFTTQDWNRLEKGTNVPLATRVVDIAVFFGCDIGWLLTGQGEPFPLAERVVVDDRPLHTPETVREPEAPYRRSQSQSYRAIPVDTADGRRGHIVIDEWSVPPHHHITATRVDDASVEPAIPCGSAILLDRDDTDACGILSRPPWERLVLVRHGDGEAIGRLDRVGTQLVVVRPDSTASPLAIDPHDILGRILGHQIIY